NFYRFSAAGQIGVGQYLVSHVRRNVIVISSLGSSFVNSFCVGIPLKQEKVMRHCRSRKLTLSSQLDVNFFTGFSRNGFKEQHIAYLLTGDNAFLAVILNNKLHLINTDNFNGSYIVITGLFGSGLCILGLISLLLIIRTSTAA